MARNAKLKELINVPLVAKYKSGFETWKTAYQKSSIIGFRIGKVIDRSRDVREPGNFVTALIQKGVRVADRTWEPTVFDPSNFTNYFDWKFEDAATGEIVYTTLTWLQNQNLQDKLFGEIPQEGVIVVPKLLDRTIDFEVKANVPPVAPQTQPIPQSAPAVPVPQATPQPVQPTLPTVDPNKQPVPQPTPQYPAVPAAPVPQSPVQTPSVDQNVMSAPAPTATATAEDAREVPLPEDYSEDVVIDDLPF